MYKGSEVMLTQVKALVFYKKLIFNFWKPME